MAVIRESRQFKIGPVGVARASDLRESSRALSETLSTVGQIQYERAARNALKVGEEAGQSAIVIDPETGLPQPLIPPKGFGSIASDAYDRVARNRFEFSIQNEIELKGQELAAKYGNNPNGSALYHQTMSDYVESMTEAAEGAGYKSYIADTGTAYRDLTTQKLAIQQQERERVEMINFAQTTFTKGTNSVEALYASNPEEAAVISQQSLQGIKDAVASNLLPKSSIKVAETQLMIAKAKGILRGLGPNVDPEDLAKIEFAFDTANKDLLPAGYLHLAPLIADFGNDFQSIETIADFATEHLRPIAILSTERVRKQEEIIADKQNQSTLGLLNDRYSVGVNAGRSITDTFDLGSEVNTSVAVNSAIKKAKVLEQNANAAFLNSESNPANLELYKQFSETALTVRSAAAQAIILGNRKKDSRFFPEDIKGIVKFLETGDRFHIEGLDSKTSSVVEMLSKVIKEDNTGEVKTGSLILLEQIMNAGDIEEASNIELGNSEVAAIEAAAFEATLGKGIEIVDILLSSIKESEAFIEGAREAGMNDTADAQVQKINETIVATVDGTIDRSLVGLSITQATQQLNAIAYKDPSLSPNKTSAEAVQMLIDLQSVYPKSGDSTIWTRADSATKSYRNGAAKAISAQQNLKRLEREDSAQHLLAGMNIPAINFGTGKDSVLDVFAERNTYLINIPSITQKDVEKGQDALRAAATKAVFQRLLATDLTEAQAGQVVSYFNDSNTTLTNLTTSQKILIKEMSGYSNSVLDKDLTKSLQSDFKGALSEVKTRLVKQEIQNKKIANQNRLTGGGGNVFESADREDMGIFMKEHRSPLFPNGINVNTYNEMDENQQSIVVSLMQSTPPQYYFDSIERMANGLPVDGADSIINLYAIMSTGISDSTTAGVNWFGDEISLEHKSLLDDAFSIVSIRGVPDALVTRDVQEVIGQLVVKSQDSNAKGNLKNVLGDLETPYAFALELTSGLVGAGDPLIATELTATVRYLGLTGKTKGMITKRIKAILDQKYPKSDFIVDSSRPVGDIKRSRFGLAATIKNEKIRNVFIETVDSEVAELSIKLQAIDSNFPELRMFTPTFFNKGAGSDSSVEALGIPVGIKDMNADLAKQRLSLKQFVTGNVMGNVYLEPDDTGAALSYRVYYADENNELVPLMYSSDANGEPVKEGTEGSIANWVSYSVNGTVGDLIRDDEKSSEIEMRVLLRKNAQSQQAKFAAEEALNEGQAGLESFARNQELTKRSQLFAPSELVGN